MFELKPLSEEGVPAALEKAHRYRLLNEPVEAESICLDILEVDPENQHALVTLLLALTDQFERHLGKHVKRARDVLDRLDDAYSRTYYDGIICERRAKAHFKRGGPGSGAVAYNWFRRAMERYEKAEALSPPGNDDAILRWNTCVRLITRHAELAPKPEREAATPRFLE